MRKGRPRKYPIRIVLMTEKSCEIVFEIDRGRDTPEDHAFVEKLMNDVADWFSARQRKLRGVGV